MAEDIAAVAQGGMKKPVRVSEGRGGMRRRQRVSSHGASFGTR